MINGGAVHARKGSLPVDLGSAINQVDDGFFDLDRNWRVRFVNVAAARMLGREVEDLVGRSIWEEFPTAVGTAFDVRYRNAFETQQVDEFEEYFDTLDMWFSIRVYPSPSGISLVFRDITPLRTKIGRAHV